MDEKPLKNKGIKDHIYIRIRIYTYMKKNIKQRTRAVSVRGERAMSPVRVGARRRVW